jgi:hypothetical protein
MDRPIRVAIALGATIFWSSSLPAIRIGLDSYDPAQLTLLRASSPPTCWCPWLSCADRDYRGLRTSH